MTAADAGSNPASPAVFMYLLYEYGILAQSVEHLTFNQGVGGSNPFWHVPFLRNRFMVGIAQLVSAPDCGSGGQGFESLYPPLRYGCVVMTRLVSYIGLSPSGKAQHFDCCSRWFESS